ncbi:MAG: chromosome segregation protein SMC [Gammaproteobacteria bacterium]|nr:chromosome segregation protein SMC [Gammaproteobacteria bacterium]
MRLEKIKLAGFKSFVDPTTVLFPGNLVGVVGPNGCGKSNVIDAVRWVMGESSAKLLRGESMSDVIFNGSSTRKSVGTASIELQFDNADGGAGGEYAQYSQISVKRQVSRDGQSNYFMNGLRCRRRDITDLFLGTGLGPRSYSIIEQGMISRLIEARPEDLRAFLEEAAGISKYKERRKETQSRIDRTRENLDRLNDLRDEITKQLEHLKRQSAVAERYKNYKSRERRLHAELLALRLHGLDQGLTVQNREIIKLETDQEALIAGQRSQEAEIERIRESHVVANEHFIDVQGRYYAIGSDIARMEQTIQFAKQNQVQMEQDLERTNRSWRESSEHRDQDERQVAEILSALDECEPRLVELRAREEAIGERLSAYEAEMQSWQGEWEQFNRRAAEPAQSAQVERTRINHLEQQDQNLRQRIERLEQELERINDPQLTEEISRLEEEASDREAVISRQQQHLMEAGEQISGRRETNKARSRSLDDARAGLQRLKGRLASLEALQEAALGKRSPDLNRWLSSQGIDQATRLAEHMEVEPGWERAVETVLGFHLQAVCVESLDQLSIHLDTLQDNSTELMDKTSGSPINTGDYSGLITRVKSPLPLENLLFGVGTAASLDEALERRTALSPGESLVTPEGIWLGRNWLRTGPDAEQSIGILAREQEITALVSEIAEQQAAADRISDALEQSRAELQRLEKSRDDMQQLFNEESRILADLRSRLSGRLARDEHLRNRRESIRQERLELLDQIEQGRERLESTREQLHAALEEMEALSDRRQALILRRDDVRKRLEESRQGAASQRTQTQELALQVQSLTTSRDSLRQNLERALGQLAHLEQHRETLCLAIEEQKAPLQARSEELEVLLGKRLEVEGELAESRKQMDNLDGELRKLEQERSASEQRVQNQREVLDQARMRRQETVVRIRTLEEQLGETEFQAERLAAEMPENASIEEWEKEVLRMDERIRRLGPINLAAIDEFQEQSERMRYLDAQHTDITESLSTLENAIRKIDRETRNRFKETFDKVNSGLQDKFPRLFGGGHAYLQLTGEDLLDTGVTVMARPPGKRNSSIQLLSGGEKALTAVALVFAIFELNPAPFCMLDEVDAPLDDSNVVRFCDMVKAMSDRVQFIFITHNKITMEIANHLMGVTMNEPGVSRLVSVDVDEAAKLAAV